MCKYGFSEIDSKNCTKQVRFGEKEMCYLINLQNGTVRRGCLLDDKPDLCDENLLSNCEICNGNGCNSNNTIVSHCIQCNSANIDEETCSETATGIISTPCQSEFENYKDRGCYTMKKEEYVIRGCVTDLDYNNRKLCEAKTKCNICRDIPGCNNQLPNSAEKFKLSSINILIFLYIMTKTCFE